MVPKATENKNLLFDKESAKEPSTFTALRDVVFGKNNKSSEDAWIPPSIVAISLDYVPLRNAKLAPKKGKKKDTSLPENGEGMNYFINGYVYTAEEAEEAEQKKQLAKKNSIVKNLLMQKCKTLEECFSQHKNLSF